MRQFDLPTRSRGALVHRAPLALRALGSALVLPCILAACGGGGGGGGGSPTPIAFDNVRSRTLNFANRQVDPLAFAPGGGTLLAVNQPGSRLVGLDLATLAITTEIPTGPGLTSVVVRPGTNEVWTVDTWTSAVSVIDLATQSIVRTVRVGTGPAAIAFTPSGDRAYVPCSQVDRVDVIDTASYSVVNSIAIPAREPNGVVFHQGHAWVASLRSGNGTAPRGRGPGAAADEVVSIDRPGVGGGNALPDRDLFAIRAEADPRDDALDASRTVQSLGTSLFDVAVNPVTGELWIPLTDALNRAVRGSVNFVGGQVVRNLIAVVDPGGAIAPRWIDLDALAPVGAECAQPTGVAFAPDGSRAYVCGFGSDVIAVLGLSGAQEQWEGVIRLPAITIFPENAGPRSALMDPAGAKLYVFDKLASAVTPIDIAGLPSSTPFDWTAPVPASLGSNPLPLEERQGRAHFVNARHSKSGTSSCNSCHVDGTTDGLVWDLSDFLDPEGTHASALAMPIDDKGPLFTQDTLQLAATAPFHWRGERAQLEDFDRTFPTLFEHEVNGMRRGLGDQFPYIRHYMQRLFRRPNPDQAFDRELRPAEARGRALFTGRMFDGGITCAACHQLPLGTSGEIVTTPVGGIPTTIVIPQLRGLTEKLTPAFDVGGDYGERTEIGAGLLHGGSAPTIEDALRDHLVHIGGASLTPEEIADLTAFLRAFDTGIAPSAAFQLTLDAQNAAGSERSVLDDLVAEARKGNCDLVAYRGPNLAAGETWPRTEAYDASLDAFVPATTTLPARGLDQLVADAIAGDPVTFLGVPLGQGRTMALDRDSDAMLDLDERFAGTDPEHPDTDRDGFFDGHEVEWGMDPLSSNASSPDTVLPGLREPNSCRLPHGHGHQARVQDHRARARTRVRRRYRRARALAAAAGVRRRVLLHRARAAARHDLHRAAEPARRRRQPPRDPVHVHHGRAALRGAGLHRDFHGRRDGDLGELAARSDVPLRARQPGRAAGLLARAAHLPQARGPAGQRARALPAAPLAARRRPVDRQRPAADRRQPRRLGPTARGHRRDPGAPGRSAARAGVRHGASRARRLLADCSGRFAAPAPVGDLRTSVHAGARAVSIPRPAARSAPGPSTMKILPRTKVPALSFETVGHGTWNLAEQSPSSFTLLVFYRGRH